MESVENKIVPVDPKQIEADMIAEAKRRSEDPAEQSAMVFTMYKGNFERALAKLRKKGAHERLIKALVMAPLEPIELLTEAEREAYFFGDSMIQAKFVMMMQTYKESAEEIMDLVKDAKVETVYEKPGEKNEASE